MNSTTLICIFVTALVGFLFGLIEHRIDKREKKDEQRDKDRQEFEILVLESINATIDLCTANNIALKNGKCNGESERAMERVNATKQNMQNYLFKKGVESFI